VWRVVAVAGAVLMPVSLSLDWYSVPAGLVTEESFSLGGWDSFESTDALMVLAAAAALVLVFTAPPYAGRALLVVGGIATGFVAVQIVDRPNLYGLPLPTPSLEIGAWLGLLGTLLILAAGALRSASGPRRAPGPEGGGSLPA
jgi:hypothetical protein